MVKWISVTLAALVLLSGVACGHSSGDRRDAFYEELREEGASQQQAEQIASYYESEIKRDQPDEFSKAYAIAIVELGQTHQYARDYAESYVEQIEAGESKEYAGTYAELRILEHKTEEYSQTYAKAYVEQIEAGESEEYASTYAALVVIGKSEEYARTYLEELAADSPAKNAVYEAEIVAGKSHDDARMYATHFVEAEMDWLPYKHAYAQARSDGETRYYANPYACAYADLIGRHSSVYAVAFAEKYAERVDYRFGGLGELSMPNCGGYNDSDRLGLQTENLAKSFARHYARQIEQGASPIYADAYARQREARQPEEFARSYAEQMEAGQSDGYAYTYATQIGEGNPAQYAHAYAEQIEAGESADYARSYAEQVAAGESADQAAQSAAAGDLLAETDRLIRTFPGEDKCYANAAEVASELLEEGKTPRYAAMYSWARECDLQSDEQAHDTAFSYE